MKPIAIFYHCLFFAGDPPDHLPRAMPIIRQQMMFLDRSGLLGRADFMLAGVNGGEESTGWVERVIPPKAIRVYHGLDSRNENKTIVEMEKWLGSHRGWLVLYFHAKGATKNSDVLLSTRWRCCMMRNLILNWRRCVKDLESGYEAVGCHWLTGYRTPPGQSIFAGNFWWAKSDFLSTLPSILVRDRIKQSGIGALESRYEAEVWIGNGPRLPRVKDYHPEHPVMGRCV